MRLSDRLPPSALPVASAIRTPFVLRIGLGSLFVAAGLAKLCALGAATTIVAERGFPFPLAVAVAVGITETFAGALLAAGVRAAGVSRLLMVMVVLAAVIFHSPFGLPPGAAHANAISLTVDALVLLGLVQVARERS
jgi:uncharacterized membrane protein YphA (DoxX/SURF4 family)